VHNHWILVEIEPHTGRLGVYDSKREAGEGTRAGRQAVADNVRLWYQGETEEVTPGIRPLCPVS